VSKARWIAAAIILMLIVIVVVLLMQVPPRLAIRTVQLEPFPDIEKPPYVMYWKDISDAKYSQEFIDSFSYDHANVSITYRTCASSYFTGTLQATGLKPNFCYQIKLSGKPTAYFGPEGDDEANERVGYAGRWWREEPEPKNVKDVEYQEHLNDSGYVHSGYLLFEFFVTDAQGAATVDFTSNSAYHVVWKISQRAPKLNDGPVSEYEVGNSRIRLYAEGEPTRNLPGQVTLPNGDYNVQLRLTEECFHDEEAFWAQVMKSDDIRFTIAGFIECCREVE